MDYKWFLGLVSGVILAYIGLFFSVNKEKLVPTTGGLINFFKRYWPFIAMAAVIIGFVCISYPLYEKNSLHGNPSVHMSVLFTSYIACLQLILFAQCFLILKRRFDRYSKNFKIIHKTFLKLRSSSDLSLKEFNKSGMIESEKGKFLTDSIDVMTEKIIELNERIKKLESKG